MFIDGNVTNVFFTSDTHWGHKNIIQYCNRPFADVKEMNQALVDNWNAKVKENDIVFHIGDLAFIKEDNQLKALIKQLNAKIIYLIPGNHDDEQRYKRLKIGHEYQEEGPSVVVLNNLCDIDIQVEDEKLRFVLCHYALRVWNKSHYGAIHLYGHSHGTLPDDPHSRSMDVGVDSHNYSPLHLDEILLKMYQKVFKPVDHHSGARK